MKTEPTEAFRAMANDLKYNVGVIHSNPQLILEESFISGVRYGQSSPKIKQLEWDVKELSSAIVECRSKTPIGDYRITHLSSVCLFDLWGSGNSNYSPFVRFGEFDTYEEAKDAAQSDFEKRIKECLDL